MRVEVPIFLFLAATGFHTALAASLESAEKKDTFAEDDQEEFEAAQMNEDAHSEDVRYLEAVQDENTEQNATQEEDMADRDRNVDADHEESESDEDVDGMRHKREYLEADVEANKTANLDFLGQKSRAL
ncbi:activating transcription factor 7-interacting protein 1 isoform X4 [Salvelinus sp. IW2-2015]|uniref:activating transcription factor 7-interacting protein 1 isoform X4 n=1 Tax=Salvelinus sp. IW2-2015 TaxID=2691554 RepID=UPI000CDFC248|nr:uncharacterized protein LOC111961515 isoform X4 [Salvelinus alpinus]